MKKIRAFLLILTLVFSLGIFASCTEVEFQINFESNGGSKVASINTLGNEVIKMPADPTKEGYTFGGWFLDVKTFLVPFTINTLKDIPLSDNMKVYAKWNDNQTDSFEPYSLKGMLVKMGALGDYYLNTDDMTADEKKLYDTVIDMYGRKVEIGSKTIKFSGTVLSFYSPASYTLRGENIIFTNSDLNETFNAATLAGGKMSLGVLTNGTGFVFEYHSKDFVPTEPTAPTKVVFNYNGATGGNTELNREFRTGEAIGALPEPEKTGYTFKGWFTAQDGGTKITADYICASSKDFTVYARWAFQNFTIDYALNGGTNNSLNPDTYTSETPTFTLYEPTKTGYAFDGWYDNFSYTGEPITSIHSGSTGSIMLMAKWTVIDYTIHYELNGGTNHSSNKTTFTVEDSFYFQYAEKANCIFDGWYKHADFSGNPVTYLAIGTAGDLTLYAKFSIETYSITYGLVGGVNHSSNPDTYTSETPTFTLYEPTKTGYAFDGWYDNFSYTGEPVTSIHSGSIGSIMLMAKWTVIDYTIHYELNGGTNHSSNITTYTVRDYSYLYSAEKEGYLFDGWYKNADFSGIPVVDITYGTVGDLMLYAKFSPTKYTVSYNLNGGVNNSANPKTYTVETPTFTLNDASKTGYTFDGWYNNAIFSGNEISSIEQGSIGNITLYAKYTPITYTITYNLNGGTNNSLNSDTYTIAATTFTLYDAAKPGYNFAGWYKNADFSGSRVTSIYSGTFGNQTLYAKFTPITYSITYTLNGGTNNSANPRTYTVETPTLTLYDASKTGYTFDGWYNNAIFSGNEISSIEQGSIGNIALYAKFTADIYTLTFDYKDASGGIAGPDKQVTFDSAVGQLPSPTQSPYAFGGWFTAENGGGTQISAYTEYKTTGNTVVYPYWLGTAGITYSVSGSVAAVSGYTGTEANIYIAPYYLGNR